MPNLDIQSTGNGPNKTAMWLDGSPRLVGGSKEWPNLGDTFVIAARPTMHHVSVVEAAEKT